MKSVIDSAIEDMKRGTVLVVLRFLDGTELMICTSLNEQLLNEYGGTFVKDHFYDLTKRRYLKFREDAVAVEILTDIPRDREVSEFVNQFI